jgi:lipoprotein-releasing system ATP-binding protein
MVQRPNLLLADECLGELDAETAKEIIDLLVRLSKEQGTAILIVDHNPVRASTFCDRVFQIRGTRLEEVDV